jgi:hypothetical protein
MAADLGRRVETHHPADSITTIVESGAEAGLQKVPFRAECPVTQRQGIQIALPSGSQVVWQAL